MLALYRPLLYLHILFGFLYMLAHGASAAAAFRLRGDTQIDRVRAMLDLSASSFGVMYGTLLGMILGGVALGFIVQAWSSGWIWLSLGILIGIFLFMAIVVSRHFHRLRKAAGLPYREGNREWPAVEPAPVEELGRLLASGKPVRATMVGLGGWAVILWLMVFKPF